MSKTLLILLCLALLCGRSHAMDLTHGLMRAVPTPGGRAPVIDGDLTDWDLSASEPVWIAPQTARQLHAHVALMFDTDALYVGANVALPGRRLRNPNSPTDTFWNGDALELRLSSDPELPAPLEPQNPAVKSSFRIAHLTLWKNSATGRDYVNIQYGVLLNLGHTVNPSGSQVAIRQAGNAYVVEARIPWSALHVPNGKNPYAPGQRMTAIWGIQWGGETQIAALYRTNPGEFAFHQAQTWGQVEFSPVGHVKALHGTMEQALVSGHAAAVGVPITITLPHPAKVSINIFGPHGEVIRELMGGEPRPGGKTTVHWDGRDAWGASVPTGVYRWGAYLSNGLRAEYRGAAGKSGTPPYNTESDRGGWGADHGPCINVAADKTGLYFLWTSAEDGRVIVKTDFQGRTLWRKTPFVGGGFGPHYGIATDGRKVYLTFGDSKPQLLRLDAATGQMLTWGNGSPLIPLSESRMVAVPPASSPVGFQPETVALAFWHGLLFAPVYSQNVVHVLDANTGVIQRDLSCPGPRGVCVDAQGTLFVASYVDPAANARVATSAIYRFGGAQGTGQEVVTTDLSAPWCVAVDRIGNLYVTDNGDSQQVKVFSPDGRPKAAWGKAGGRAWSGTYDRSSFLQPAGIAADPEGGILVAEASLPKVMSRFRRDGHLVQRWFGSVGYTAMDFGDPRDPRTVYYPLEPGSGFARAHIPKQGVGVGEPDAYWQLDRAGVADVGTLYDRMAAPFIVMAAGGRRYFVSDTNPHGISLMQGDALAPVGHARVIQTKGSPARLELWTDLNGDHHLQPDEVTVLTTVEGAPLVDLAIVTGSMWMQPNGDLYLVTQANRILKIPSAGIDATGAIHWDTIHASYVVPTVLDRVGTRMPSFFREGIAGIRIDSHGNLYTCFSTIAPYASPERTAAMKEGLGHSGGPNAVKFAKYGPDGRLIWMAGRKATTAARPGEMYHFWVLGGLVGDQYVAGCSEWGQIYFYTHDGFFVDALMNNPGLSPPAGPYTFGSETFGGRVQDYPTLDQVWAYSCGYAYQVLGFQHGRVTGEQRLWGHVKLSHVMGMESPIPAASPIVIAPVSSAPRVDSPWNTTESRLTRNGHPLGTVKFGYDAQFLYVRFHVVETAPLKNSADTVSLAFKGGDAVGVDLGTMFPHTVPAPGDIRILAALVHGQPHLIAMKPLTRQEKRPERYITPASGEIRFEFVGDVPGGSAVLQPDTDGHGYTALIRIPRRFLELPLQTGGILAADAEILLAGQGTRGLQTTSRNYLFSPRRTETTMVDDIPTEARLSPQFWGTAQVK